MTREELFNLVCSAPVAKVAPSLGVSGSYLARVCFALDVPRPPPGYWALHAVGRAPPLPALPPPAAGSPSNWVRHGNERPVIQQFYMHPNRIKRVGADARTVGQLLVAKTARHLRAAAQKTELKDTYLVPPIRRPLVVDLITTAAGLEGCLKFASLLVGGLERRGHRVAVAGSFEKFSRVPIETTATTALAIDGDVRQKMWPPRPTVAYINSVPIGIVIVEMSRHVKVRYDGYSKFVPLSEWKGPETGYSWTTTRLLPTGLMKLVTYSRYIRKEWHQQWCEKASGDLCRMIPSIVTDLERAAKLLSHV